MDAKILVLVFLFSLCCYGCAGTKDKPTPNCADLNPHLDRVAVMIPVLWDVEHASVYNRKCTSAGLEFTLKVSGETEVGDWAEYVNRFVMFRKPSGSHGIDIIHKISETRKPLPEKNAI